jgi:hypothetical protein
MLMKMELGARSASTVSQRNQLKNLVNASVSKDMFLKKNNAI